MLQKTLRTLSIIIFLIGLFYLGTLVYNRFFRTESLLDEKIEKVSNEKKVIKSEIELSYKEIDSFKKVNSKSELNQSKEIKNYYTDKGKLVQKIKEDEKNISNNNPDSDSIYRYLSRYKYIPIY